MLYRLTLNSHRSLLSRHIAGYICDINKHRIFSEVKYRQNITFFESHVHLNGICCAFVDSSQSTMTMIFEYSGSLAQHLTSMNFSRHAGDTHGLPIMLLNDYIP